MGSARESLGYPMYIWLTWIMNQLLAGMIQYFYSIIC